MKSLLPILMLVASVAGFFMYIKPTYGEIQTMRDQQTRYLDVLDQTEKAGAKLTDLQNTAASFSEEDTTNLEKMLPDRIDPIRYAVDLVALGAKYKTKIQSLRLGDTGATNSGNSTTGVFQVNFSVNLTYDNFLLFVRDVEKTLKLVDITAVTFAPASSGAYDYNLTLKTYWLK